VFSRLEDYISKVNGEFIYKSVDENDINDLFIGPHIVQIDKNELLNYDEVFYIFPKIVTACIYLDIWANSTYCRS
jgi:hypothetical protein